MNFTFIMCIYKFGPISNLHHIHEGEKERKRLLVCLSAINRKNNDGKCSLSLPVSA